jgi:hypothetical protein
MDVKVQTFWLQDDELYRVLICIGNPLFFKCEEKLSLISGASLARREGVASRLLASLLRNTKENDK